MFRDVTLEMSLKPFKQTDLAYVQQVCRTVFEQWRPLLKGKEKVSILLWVGDGSELLDYAGRLEDPMEWARFVGTANLPYLEEGAPLETGLHERKQDYIPHPPAMTYGTLKTIIAFLRAEGQRCCPDATIRIGETFDIGPEFAVSDFRYRRHRECLSLSSDCDGFGFVDVSSRLHGDSRPYAAYPKGIPEGTPFAAFLARQTAAFFQDLGFDYLWLSNGLGFSADPWKTTGKIFDGERYYPEKLSQTKAKVFEFWTLFRKHCPHVPLETRGTNNSVGIDYASDGVPLYDIYRGGFDMVAPPNSPWAAINDNYGLELMGHMTRICHLPNDSFPFRYYLHDPWWLNSPWYDRYDNSPCDIYLPMAIARIDENGKVQTANKLNLLSIDNSYGGLPDACVNEPIPHLLKADKDAPDEIAPLVWIYPMREYSTTEDPRLLREMHQGDSFICHAINDGFPLCCVTPTDFFVGHEDSLYQNRILLSPVPTEEAVKEKLLRLARQGVNTILYGTQELLATLGEEHPFVTVPVSASPSALRECLASFGYTIAFDKKDPATKPPALALFRNDKAFYLAGYNPNTTTATTLGLPWGAPILCGMEAELCPEGARYHFARGEHRECRVITDQKEGVISCREAPPKTSRYRRALRISGLKNATVRLLGERSCECAVSTVKTTYTPVFDPRFQKSYDPFLGWHLKGENVSGEIYFLIGHRNTWED